MAAKRPSRRRARNPWVRRLKRTLWFLSFTTLLAVSAGLVVYIPIYQEAADDAQNIDRKLVVNDEKPTVIVSADRTPKVLDSVATVRRKIVKLRDLPDHVRYAFVAAEDRRFYDHKGVDPIGLARAVYYRGSAGGGSTIPMQLAKLMINGDARTPLRKLKDIATAQQIESLKTKDEILDLYVNYAFFGEHAYGLQRAAEIYFGKDAKDLTVGEAAMLARSVRLPGRVNPRKSPEKMIDLRDYVLRVERDENWITQKQYDDAVREVPKLNPNPTFNARRGPKEAGHFTDHVWEQLKRDFPDIDFRAGGYRVVTTLNYALQQRAVQAVQNVLRESRGHKVNDGAIVVMDQNGRILCEVGGPDYATRQFNVVTQGIGRQPGSAFKAIVYATALRNGTIDLNTRLSNARLHVEQPGGKIWDPDNASPSEDRASSYTLMDAFAHSVNRPAIHTLYDTGPESVVKAAHDVFGIKSVLGATGALALGAYDVHPLEMLEAYSVFMLNGDRVEPQCISKVYDPQGNLLRDYTPLIHPKVLDEGVATQMDEVMKGPVQFGTATAARDVPNARGKTGTTNDSKDAWFCGYSDGLVGIGWVGNSQPKTGKALPMGSRVFGGTVTVKIWREVMLVAHKMGLATGVKASPNTTVRVEASPDEPYVPPVRGARHNDAPARDVKEIEPGPGPRMEPDPDATEPPTVKDPDYPDSIPPPDSTTVPPSNSGESPVTSDPPPISRRDDEDAAARRREARDASRQAAREARDARRRAAAEAANAEVPVEVCVDTGMRAGMYCPETVTRSFPKGRVPKRRCTMHHG